MMLVGMGRLLVSFYHNCTASQSFAEASTPSLSASLATGHDANSRLSPNLLQSWTFGSTRDCLCVCCSSLYHHPCHSLTIFPPSSLPLSQATRRKLSLRPPSNDNSAAWNGGGNRVYRSRLAMW